MSRDYSAIRQRLNSRLENAIANKDDKVIRMLHEMLDSLHIIQSKEQAFDN